MYSCNIEYFYVKNVEWVPELYGSSYEKHIIPGMIYRGVSIFKDEVYSSSVILLEAEEGIEEFIFMLGEDISDVKLDIRSIDVEDLTGLQLEPEAYLRAAEWIDEDESRFRSKLLATVFEHNFLSRISSFSDFVRDNHERIKADNKVEEDDEDGTNFEESEAIEVNDLAMMLATISERDPSIFNSLMDMIINIRGKYE